MILHRTRGSYSYKTQQHFCFANVVFKNIAWSKPVKELLCAA